MTNPSGTNSHRRKALTVNHMMTVFFYGMSVTTLALLLAIIGYLFWLGLKDFSPALLSFSPKGIGNQLFNTIYLVVLALCISVPIGIGTGIYMAEYAKPGRLQTTMRISIETLSSLPSIVVGLFGYLVFIILTGSQWNLLAGALTVSILTLPLIATITEDALRALPPGYAKGSYGMGATKWQTITNVLLPAAFPSILTGIVLAAGRVFGEAAALMFTAGMSTDINWNSSNLLSPTNPFNPMRPGETLALHIWASRTEALNADAAAMANMSALCLLLLVLAVSIGARYLHRYLSRTMLGATK